MTAPFVPLKNLNGFKGLRRLHWQRMSVVPDRGRVQRRPHSGKTALQRCRPSPTSEAPKIPPDSGSYIGGSRWPEMSIVANQNTNVSGGAPGDPGAAHYFLSPSSTSPGYRQALSA
jgi:hypothetical protein